VRIASRCSSVARNWPSSCSVPRAGSSRRCAAMSSTWRSRARTPACSSERPREERPCDHGDDERHEHRRGDPDEQARAKAHGTSL
jgi:hypothetical protein